MSVFADGGMFIGKASQRWKLFRTRANGLPAFVIYQRTEGGKYRAFGVHVLCIEGEQLSQLITFIDPTLPVFFGFPQFQEITE